MIYGAVDSIKYCHSNRDMTLTPQQEKISHFIETTFIQPIRSFRYSKLAIEMI